MLCLIENSNRQFTKERPIRLWIGLLAMLSMLFFFNGALHHNSAADSPLDEQLEYAALTRDLPALRSVWFTNHRTAPQIADLRSHLGPALRAAACAGDEAAVCQLLQWGADPNARSAAGKTPLMCAAGSPNSAAVARQLLESGADPRARNRKGQTPLSVAIAAHDFPLITLLKLEFRI
jgi:hypothetical protein